MLIAVKSLVNTGGRDNPRGNPVVYCSLKHTILGTLLFSFGTVVSTISKNTGQKKPGLLFCYFCFTITVSTAWRLIENFNRGVNSLGSHTNTHDVRI